MKIFDPDSATPGLAAARLQHCSLLLSSYHYEIEFKSSAEVASADALSRQTILTEFHDGHLGIARMKSIARSHVWWPKIDQEIEKATRECQPCNKTGRSPPASPLLPWSWPTAPWQRVHVDFATHEAKHYLIMVDAHSKWPEVIGPMKTTTADSTINAMRNIFLQDTVYQPK